MSIGREYTVTKSISRLSFRTMSVFVSVQSDSLYAVPSVLHVVCNTLVGAYVSFWMAYDFSMEWSYRVRYVRFVGHMIPALRLATYMLTQYQHFDFFFQVDGNDELLKWREPTTQCSHPTLYDSNSNLFANKTSDRSKHPRTSHH